MTAYLRVSHEDMFRVLADAPRTTTPMPVRVLDAVREWATQLATTHHDAPAGDYNHDVPLPSPIEDPQLAQRLCRLGLDIDDDDQLAAVNLWAAVCYCQARDALGYQHYRGGGYSDDEHYDAARDLGLTQ